MTKRSLIMTGTMAILSALFLFTACKRDKIGDNDVATEETGYADDIARADQVFDEVDNFAEQADEMGSVELKGGPNTLGNCAVVTKDTIGSPDSVIIDFGPTNCLCKDGRYRRGKILVSQVGKYKDNGFTRTIGFDGYYVNDNYVYGGRTITNMGKNSAGHIYYNISIDGHMILNATNDSISHVASRVRTYTAGESTPQVADDEYDITGGGTHVKKNGKTFTTNITTPLHVAANCNWIESGVMSITPQGLTGSRVLDYGNGNCDNQATITVNSKTKNIILK